MEIDQGSRREIILFPQDIIIRPDQAKVPDLKEVQGEQVVQDLYKLLSPVQDLFPLTALYFDSTRHKARPTFPELAKIMEKYDKPIRSRYQSILNAAARSSIATAGDVRKLTIDEIASSQFKLGKSGAEVIHTVFTPGSLLLAEQLPENPPES